MRSNLSWSSSLHHPFSVSVVSVQSQGACLFCWATLSCMFLFYVQVVRKSWRWKKKLSINILCHKPSAQQVKCLTVARVAVISSLAEPNILRIICVLVISFVMMRTEIVLETLVDLHFSHLMQLIALEISLHLVTMKTSDFKFLQVLIYCLCVQVHRCNDLP